MAQTGTEEHLRMSRVPAQLLLLFVHNRFVRAIAYTVIKTQPSVTVGHRCKHKKCGKTVTVLVFVSMKVF